MKIFHRPPDPLWNTGIELAVDASRRQISSDFAADATAMYDFPAVLTRLKNILFVSSFAGRVIGKILGIAPTADYERLDVSESAIACVKTMAAVLV